MPKNLSLMLWLSMLLSKIKDRDNSHIVDILIASNDDFETCVTRLLDKYNMMNSENNAPRLNNKVKRGNNRPNNRNQRYNDGNHNSKQAHNTRQNQNTNTYISDEKWNKLSFQGKETL